MNELATQVSVTRVEKHPPLYVGSFLNCKIILEQAAQPLDLEAELEAAVMQGKDKEVMDIAG